LQALLDLLESDEYQNALSFLQESPHYQAVIDALLENGIDLNLIYNYLSRELEMTDY
jgi:hypothetical protein